MSRKRLITFFIAGVMMFSSGNVIAAQSNAADTLDIEKTAIETIKNSTSIKTSAKQTKNAQNVYYNAKAAAQMALSMGRGDLVNIIVYNPISAENLLNQFITNELVNTNSVRIDAYSKYISLLKANYAVNIQRALNDSLKKTNAKTQLQLSNGSISKSDARLVEINYSKSNYMLDSYERNLDSAYMDVNLAMGQDISKRYTSLIDKNIVPDEKIKPLDDYIEAALASRGEIVNAQNALDAKKKAFEYDKGVPRTDYAFYIKKTQYEIDKDEKDLEKTKINVQLEITNGYKTLEGYMKAMESQQINYDLAKSNFESAKIKYSNDMITINQLIDAEIAKSQAQIDLKNAQLDAWLEQAKMNNATGVGPALK